MPASPPQKPDQHRIYRIQIEGSLDPGWSDRLGGLAITSSGRFGTKTKSVLEGELKDQGALLGVLNALYELRLSIETVEAIPPDRSEPAAQSD
jgi:hypothetical protein